MKILIVEDNDMRIEWFKRVYRAQELHFASTCQIAECIVREREYDAVFLDHDLLQNNHEAINIEQTGYDFVRFMIKNNLCKTALVYVHSMNPTGANAMLNLLLDNKYQAEWIPFHLLKLEDRGD